MMIKKLVNEGELYIPEEPDTEFFDVGEVSSERTMTCICKKCGWDFTGICYGDMDDWWLYSSHCKIEDHKRMCKMLEL